MPNYVRARQHGGTFFLTFVTHARRRFLTEPLAIECVTNAYRETCWRYRFHLHAFCMMPDHLHVLVTLPHGDADFSKRCSFFKSAFTRTYLAAGGQDGVRNTSRYRSGEAAVWQRRFWEQTIGGDEDFQRHFDYIHFNPVKHGLVTRPEEWIWSTFERYKQKGWYNADWGEVEPRTIATLESVGE